MITNCNRRHALQRLPLWCSCPLLIDMQIKYFNHTVSTSMFWNRLKSSLCEVLANAHLSRTVQCVWHSCKDIPWDYTICQRL